MNKTNNNNPQKPAIMDVKEPTNFIHYRRISIIVKFKKINMNHQVICNVNKANTYKSRARLTDKE